MPKVTVEYVGFFSKRTGKAREQVWLREGSYLDELLADIAARHPTLREELFEGGRVKPTLLVMVNGRAVNLRRDLRRVVLKDLDVVTISPPPPLGGKK